MHLNNQRQDIYAVATRRDALARCRIGDTRQPTVVSHFDIECCARRRDAHDRVVAGNATQIESG